jgi:hypothetical protein
MNKIYKNIHIAVSLSMAFIMLMFLDISPISHCLRVTTVSLCNVHHSNRVSISEALNLHLSYNEFTTNILIDPKGSQNKDAS